MNVCAFSMCIECLLWVLFISIKLWNISYAPSSDSNLYHYMPFCFTWHSFSVVQSDWRVVTSCSSFRVINISWWHQLNEFWTLKFLPFFKKSAVQKEEEAACQSSVASLLIWSQLGFVVLVWNAINSRGATN